MRSLPSAIDALDTLYEPNAVFSQFLGSASMTFFLFPSLASSSCLVLSCFSCLFFSLLAFFFSFLLFSFLSFPFLSLLIFSLFLFSNRLASDVRMRSDRYYVYYICGGLSWAASGIVGFSRLE